MDERVADCEQDFRVLSNIGTIEVVVLRCRPAHGDTQPLNDSPEDPHSHHKAYWKSWGKDRVRVAATAEKPSQPQSQAVFEKDIKGRGISHRVATEPEKPTTRRSAAFNYLDSFENPYCILVMQYRSRGLFIYAITLRRCTFLEQNSFARFMIADISSWPQVLYKTWVSSHKHLLNHPHLPQIEHRPPKLHKTIWRR